MGDDGNNPNIDPAKCTSIDEVTRQGFAPRIDSASGGLNDSRAQRVLVLAKCRISGAKNCVATDYLLSL
jgi:hypothetical protein